MSYESGMLVRRQQREYPPELRQEIALTALEVGNNREVARLYSERLGYTVNESTVRGIKKRYLECLSRNGGEPPKEGEDKEEEEEEVQPANVMKLQLDILGTDTRMLGGVGTVEVMEAVHGDDTIEEDNTIETNGSESGEANGLSINGEDSNDSFVNQLSIDTGDASTDTPAPNKPTIRIAKGLHKSPELQKSRSSSPAKLSVKRKSTSSTNGLATKKLRPSLAEAEADIASLEKEVRALQWLARRKEQEWDQAVRLLKQKEEKLIRALRNKTLAAIEAENTNAKIRLSVEATTPNPATLVQPQPVIVPQQQVMLLPQQPSRIVAPKIAHVVRPAVATSPTVVRSSKSPSPASRPSQPQRPSSNNSATSASGDLSEAKFATVLQKASKNLQKAANQGKKEKKNTPQCQGCGNKKSEFVCAGCSNRWYCSRECQVEDWDEHADECAG